MNQYILTVVDILPELTASYQPDRPPPPATLLLGLLLGCRHLRTRIVQQVIHEVYPLLRFGVLRERLPARVADRFLHVPDSLLRI